jgi:hypothetical protein
MPNAVAIFLRRLGVVACEQMHLISLLLQIGNGGFGVVFDGVGDAQNGQTL